MAGSTQESDVAREPTILERLEQLEADQREIAGAHIAFCNRICERVLKLEFAVGLAKADEPMGAHGAESGVGEARSDRAALMATLEGRIQIHAQFLGDRDVPDVGDVHALALTVAVAALEIKAVLWALNDTLISLQGDLRGG